MNVEDGGQESPRSPYLLIACGLVLFALGLGIDLYEHGIEFLIDEFRGSPVAHGLPLLGIVLVAVGVVMGLRATAKLRF